MGMIAKCNLKGIPVVTATQMLESMGGNPRPTRAEASDVANAVLDGSDVVMLSGETAGGAFPLNAVATMRRICETAEQAISYSHLFNSMKDSALAHYGSVSVPESVCSAAVLATIDCKAALIIVLTETGQTARLVSKYRPSVPILALSAAESSVKQLSLHRGVVALQVASFQGTENVLKSAMETAKSMDEAFCLPHVLFTFFSSHSAFSACVFFACFEAAFHPPEPNTEFALQARYS